MGNRTRHPQKFGIGGFRGADGLPGEDIAANLVDACDNQVAGFAAYPGQRIWRAGAHASRAYPDVQQPRAPEIPVRGVSAVDLPGTAAVS
jgi:hypothetical protein